MERLGKSHLCEYAQDGKEAVKIASRLLKNGEKLNFVLKDFMVPKVTGIQAVQRIKAFIQNMKRDKHVAKEPIFGFLTAYKTSTFLKLCEDL